MNAVRAKELKEVHQRVKAATIIPGEQWMLRNAGSPASLHLLISASAVSMGKTCPRLDICPNATSIKLNSPEILYLLIFYYL